MTTPASSIHGAIKMPSYNVRHSIATKVAVKKTAKGYTLSEENCGVCEMSLMTLKDKSDCKVCPAIKKWVQRQNEAEKVKEEKACTEVVDAREVVETIQEEVEIREEIRADSPTVHKFPVDPPSACCEKSEFSDVISEERSELLESNGSDPPSACCEKSEFSDVISDERSELLESNGSAIGSPHRDEESELLENSDSVIDSLESYEKSELADSGSYETSGHEENVNYVVSFERKYQIEEDASNCDRSEADDEITIDESLRDMAVSETGTWESDAYSRDYASASQYLSRSESEESQTSSDIRERARQIIMDARVNGGLRSESESDDDSSWNSETMSFAKKESIIEEKAADIIDQARKNVQAEEGGEFSPEPTMESIDSESDEESDEEISSGMGAYEAAIVIQCVARKFLAKKSFLELINEEAIDEKVNENNEVKEGTAEQGTSAHFVSLGVSNPTQEEEEDCAPAEEAAKGLKQEADAEIEDLIDHISQDTSQSQAATNFDSTQDTSDATIAGNEEPAPINEEVDPLVQEPTLVTEKVPQAENVMVSQKQQVNEYEYNQVLPAPNTVANSPKETSRGFFAGLACKFDDAVTDAVGKVHSIVTCSVAADEGGLEGFGNAFETQQSKYKSAATSSSGMVKHKASLPSHYKYDEQATMLAESGWQVVNAGCHRCNKLLMVRPEDGQLVCCGCETIEFKSGPMAVPSSRDQDAAPNIVRNSAPKTMVPAHQARPTPDASNGLLPPTQARPPLSTKQQEVFVPSHSQILQMMQTTPNAPMDMWASSDEAKENASRDAHALQQMEDTKLRIEDAKKFIMSRNGRREIGQTTVKNMTPGTQRIPFRPQSNISRGPNTANSQPLMNVTPGDHVKPVTQSNIFRPPLSPSAGAQTYKNLGSLMSVSPENKTSGKHTPAIDMGVMSPANQPRVNAVQLAGMTSPGTQRASEMLSPGAQDSGHRTPQMPGRYFFA